MVKTIQLYNGARNVTGTLISMKYFILFIGIAILQCCVQRRQLLNQYLKNSHLKVFTAMKKLKFIGVAHLVNMCIASLLLNGCTNHSVQIKFNRTQWDDGDIEIY